MSTRSGVEEGKVNKYAGIWIGKAGSVEESVKGYGELRRLCL